MKKYGIIPSRFGSSRFPGKPLAMLAGKPLVAWVFEAVKKAKSLDDVFVATDDERIVKAVEEHGGKAVMTPSELPSGTDRIACAARNFFGGDFADDDILVNIQGDEPLIDPGLIDELVAALTDSDVEMATAVTPIKTADDFAAKTVVKVVLDREDRALYFSRAPIPCDRDHAPFGALGNLRLSWWIPEVLHQGAAVCAGEDREARAAQGPVDGREDRRREDERRGRRRRYARGRRTRREAPC